MAPPLMRSEDGRAGLQSPPAVPANSWDAAFGDCRVTKQLESRGARGGRGVRGALRLVAQPPLTDPPRQKPAPWHPWFRTMLPSDAGRAIGLPALGREPFSMSWLVWFCSEPLSGVRRSTGSEAGRTPIQRSLAGAAAGQLSADLVDTRRRSCILVHGIDAKSDSRRPRGKTEGR